MLWPISLPCGAQYLDAVQLALEGIDQVQMLLDKDPSMTLAEDADEMEQIFIKGDVAVLIGFEGCLLLINPNINTYHLLIHRSTCSRLQFSCTPFYARPGDTIYIPCWCSVYHTIRKGVLSEGR